MLENIRQQQNQSNSNNNSREECINVIVRIRGKSNEEIGQLKQYKSKIKHFTMIILLI